MPDLKPDVTAQLLRALSSRIARPAGMMGTAAEEKVSPQRWSYREAAAVLHCFDPAQLRPLNPQLAVESPRLLLHGDSVAATGGREGGMHTLKPAVRREALRRLGSRELLREALAANPDRPMTDVQKMLEAWIAGSAPPLERQSYEELNQTLQVISWMEGVLDGLPAEAEVRERLARRTVLRPFDHLVSRDFVGRERELARLRDYVGVLPPDSLLSAAHRGFRAFFKIESRPPLLLHGPGGIGKSALVGKFLQEHSEAPPELRFPFAYLPFDNPLLQVKEPFTLLVEAADQLARQYPEQEWAHAEFRERIASYRSARTELGGKASLASSRQGKLGMLNDLDGMLFRGFGELLRGLAGGERPFLLVFDTFEEVQYRPRQELLGLGRMLETIQRHFPLLRVVASGRAPAEELTVDGVKPESLALGDLDMAAALRLLASAGAGDPELAQTLFKQLGGNPLTLKLAARAVTSSPELADGGGLTGVTTRRFLFFSVPQELIQGQLYRRVLDHIRDPEVRKLAHPGMVLRRVTPAAIREVLSDPCGVEVPDEKAAERLFGLLRREHALVRLDEGGVLQYRPEVRQPMLKMLLGEKPAQVRQIHEAAVWFWAAQEGLPARTEELYHRLALDQEPGELEDRWIEEAGPSLAASREELPPRAMGWLASRMSLAVDPAVLKAADQASWERATGRRVIHELRYDVKSALGLLRERPDRLPESALCPLEARAHLLAGSPHEALNVLERGIASMPFAGNPGRLAEMLWLHAQAAVLEGRFDVAETSLSRAEVVARGISDPLCRLQVLTQRLLLRRRLEGGADGDTSLSVLRDVLAHILTRLDEEQMDREPVLARIAAAELAPEHWPTLRRVIATVGIGPLSPEAEHALRSALAGDVALAGDAPPEPAPRSLDSLCEHAFQEDAPRAARAVTAALRSQGLTLDAANLAGIEEYREPWETEISAEAEA